MSSIISTQPNFRSFPLAGWQNYPIEPKRADPSKMCPRLSFYDDYMALRGQAPNTVPHYANDLTAPIGTSILNISPGVGWANIELGDKPNEFIYFKNGGYHAYVLGDDGFIYYYAHMHRPPYIKPGQRVAPAQLIGHVGKSGNTYGCPHLHLAIFKVNHYGQKGATINPYPYLKATEPFALARWVPGRPITKNIPFLLATAAGGYLFYRYLKNRQNRL